MRVRRAMFAVTFLALCTGAASQPSSSGWFDIPANAVYQTGDSWIADGVVYRLYGVQSCIRGTSFTNSYGIKRDCGEASLAMLVAYVRDLRPRCYRAIERPQPNAVFVFCVATPMVGAAGGSRIDLGTALIATGYAFAALTPDGKPVHPPYLAAELVAQNSKAGLWAFADAPEPNAVILRAIEKQTPAPPQMPPPSAGGTSR